jgi:hypothetical protein
MQGNASGELEHPLQDELRLAALAIPSPKFHKDKLVHVFSPARQYAMQTLCVIDMFDLLIEALALAGFCGIVGFAGSRIRRKFHRHRLRQRARAAWMIY